MEKERDTSRAAIYDGGAGWRKPCCVRDQKRGAVSMRPDLWVCRSSVGVVCCRRFVGRPPAAAVLYGTLGAGMCAPVGSHGRGRADLGRLRPPPPPPPTHTHTQSLAAVSRPPCATPLQLAQAKTHRKPNGTELGAGWMMHALINPAHLLLLLLPRPARLPQLVSSSQLGEGPA